VEVGIYIHNYVPIEEWSNELAVYGKVKVDRDCSREWKRGLNARLVLHTRPETQWATHEQVEVRVKPSRGPNR
jgi:hypothetical protein